MSFGFEWFWTSVLTIWNKLFCYYWFTSDFSAKKMDASTAFANFCLNSEEFSFSFHSCDCGNGNIHYLGFHLVILCTGIRENVVFSIATVFVNLSLQSSFKWKTLQNWWLMDQIHPWLKTVIETKSYLGLYPATKLSVVLLPPALKSAPGWLLANAVMCNSAMLFFPRVL